MKPHKARDGKQKLLLVCFPEYFHCRACYGFGRRDQMHSEENNEKSRLLPFNLMHFYAMKKIFKDENATS